MAPSIRYARDLVIQGYVGEVLGTTMVGSGLAWTSVSDSAHAYMFDAAKQRHLALRTDDACAGRTTVRRWRPRRYPRRERRAPPAVRLADTNEEIRSPRRPGPSGDRRGAGERRGGLDLLSRRHVSRGDNFRWEINGSKAISCLRRPLGNLQVLAPTLVGGHDEDTPVAPLAIPAEYDLVPGAPEGPAANVARLYAAFAADRRQARPGHRARLRACAAFASHAGPDLCGGGKRHRATSDRASAVRRRAAM